MITGTTHAHLGPIWYHSKRSDYILNQFLSWDFFAASYSKTALANDKIRLRNNKHLWWRKAPTYIPGFHFGNFSGVFFSISFLVEDSHELLAFVVFGDIQLAITYPISKDNDVRGPFSVDLPVFDQRFDKSDTESIHDFLTYNEFIR